MGGIVGVRIRPVKTGPRRHPTLGGRGSDTIAIAHHTVSGLPSEVCMKY
jgi:hypothetical protein